MSTLSDPASEGRPNQVSPLRVVLHVDPHPDAACAVLESGKNSEHVSQNIIRRNGGLRCKGECRAEVTVTGRESTRRRFVADTVDERCICPALQEHDCVAEIDAIRGGSLIFSVTVPNREELRRVVATLRETGADVGLRQIRQLEDEHSERTVHIDANSITDKQREAIEAAHEEGYYETPRKADLEDLAERLGISPSAVSQRLNAAESKLVRELCRIESGE